MHKKKYFSKKSLIFRFLYCPSFSIATVGSIVHEGGSAVAAASISRAGDAVEEASIGRTCSAATLVSVGRTGSVAVAA